VRGASAALAFLLVACSGEDTPTGVITNVARSSSSAPGPLVLCKYTAEPTSEQFDFVVSATGGAVVGDGHFSLNAINVLGSPAGSTGGPECATVWNATDDLHHTVTIEEIVEPGFEIFGVFHSDPGWITPIENPVELTISPRGGLVIFKNRPVDKPPESSCSECLGGVTQMTLRNNGPSGEVVVKAGKDEIFRGVVASGETFTVHGTKKDGKLGKEIKIRVAGGEETKIHTSCSKPIGPGMHFGAFEVVEALNGNGDLICPPGEDDCDDLCDAGKPAVLTMLLTGDDCSATSHTQDSKKVSCEDFGALVGDLRVVVTDKKDPGDSKAKTWFDGTVSVGSAFDITAAAAGQAKLKANTWVNIYDAGGTLLQVIQFHTSCSQPLELDNQFGGLQLTGFTPEA
jgi:hypothetical protein